jgi:TonB-linked SusC/RagA family outer membrane protein
MKFSANGIAVRLYQQQWNKIILVMKLTTLLLIIALVQASAKGYSQNITLHAQNASLYSALQQVKKQSGYVFISNNFNLKKPVVNVNIDNATIEQALSACFDGLPLQYKIVDKTVVVVQTPVAANQRVGAAAITIQGSIVDEKGAPLPGATIAVKGGSLATLSNDKGRFMLNNVPDDAILVVSFIGYASQEVSAKGNLDAIRLTPFSADLNQVVVVGYGTQKKVVVSGAVSDVKGAELAKSSSVNLSNSLAGRLSGVVAIQPSGEPGGDGSTIRIRGINSLSGGNTSPLIVIDGVPGRAGGLDRINPNDIESVSVLKDASAAIYGSRAGNGVILITTKQGKSGKPTLSYDFFYGLQRPTRTPKMANASEYAEIMNELQIFNSGLGQQYWGAAWQALKTTGSYTRPDNNSNINAAFNPEALQKFRDGSDPLRYPNTDWFSTVFKDWAPQQRHNLQVSGGNEHTKYLVSLGFLNQDGFYRNSATKYKQYDMRVNVESKINKYITTGLSLIGREENPNYPTVSAGNIFRFMMRGRPTDVAIWPNGLPGTDIENGINPVVASTNLSGYDKQVRDYLQTTGKLEIRIPYVDGLKVTGTASIDKYWDRRTLWRTPYQLYAWDQVSLQSDGSPKLQRKDFYPDQFRTPNLSETSTSRLDVNLTGLINYDKVIHGHSIALLAGVQRETANSNGFNAFRSNFISSQIPVLSFGQEQGQTIGVNGVFKSARLSYFGSASYNYKEKYIAQFLWRVDGSYIFPPTHRFGFFPGVSAAWRVSEEGFFKNNVPFINNLKLRGSWGRMGAEAYYSGALKEYQYLTLLATSTNMFGDRPVTTVYEGSVPNTNFTWEVANNSDIGLDASFLNNKLALTVDYFYNLRSDVLAPKIGSIPGSAGIPSYNFPPVNLGKLKNSGFDFSLNYTDKAGELNYSVGVNGGYAKNKILFFDETPGAPDWQRATGYPTDALLYQYDGVFKDQAEIAANTLNYSGLGISNSSLRPGDMKFKDINNDGKINADDRVRMNKNGTPTFTGGVNVYLQYKGFDLSVLMQGALGGLQKIGLTESGSIGNYLNWSYQKRWSIDQPSNVYPRLSDSNSGATYFTTSASDNTYYVINANYIRLKNVELGYTLPKPWLQKVGISALRIYANGINLATFDKIKIWDPESTNSSGQYYPQAKIINMGVKLTF